MSNQFDDIECQSAAKHEMVDTEPAINTVPMAAEFKGAREESITTTDIDGSASGADSDGEATFDAPEKNEPQPLGSWSATFILINFISMGYILNPSGKIP